MQTFLPYADYSLSAAVMDNQRLGNQCYRECLTIIRGGWSNHPVSRMWRGYEHALCEYAFACAVEMPKRGHWQRAVTVRWQIYWAWKMTQYPNTGNPPWIGDQQFHLTHQRVLLHKHYDWYKWVWPWLLPLAPIEGSYPYVWPV